MPAIKTKLLLSIIAVLFVSLLISIYLNFQKPTPPIISLPTLTIYPSITPISTNKFVDQKSKLTPTPFKNINTIKYLLPQGFQTVNDNSQIFQLGYNSTEYDAKSDSKSISIIRKDLNTDPKHFYSPYSNTFNFMVLAYNNDSRHKFIENYLGESLNSGNKLPNYSESEFVIAGKNCLILNGISISQYPTVWGVCPISTSHALLFNGFDFNTLKFILATLKFTL